MEAGPKLSRKESEAASTIEFPSRPFTKSFCLERSLINIKPIKRFDHIEAIWFQARKTASYSMTEASIIPPALLAEPCRAIRAIQSIKRSRSGRDDNCERPWLLTCSAISWLPPAHFAHTLASFISSLLVSLQLVSSFRCNFCLQFFLPHRARQHRCISLGRRKKNTKFVKMFSVECN